jgi:hypothetical protein
MPKPEEIATGGSGLSREEILQILNSPISF